MQPHDVGVNHYAIVEERRGKKAVLTFGRFNPPTSGHELLINKVLAEAKKRRADNFIFASHSQDKKKNPLDSRTKTKHMKSLFKGANVIYNTSIRTIFDAIGYLADEGYKDVTVVVGGDRTAEFERTIRPYVNHPDPDKSFDLESFEVVSAGQRDPDATDVTGMSASKMRKFAAEGDFRSFRKGVPSAASDRQARKLFDDVRKGMAVSGGDIIEEVETPPEKIKVLVFSGYSEENDGNLMKTAGRIKEECDEKGIDCFVAFVPYARSIKNEDGTRTVVNKDGEEFVANRHDTVVVVRGAAAGNSGTLDLISSFEKDGFFVINSRESIDICSDKYRTALTLVEADLPTPRTALITDPQKIDEIHEQVGGEFPVVAKTIRGSKGKGVFILESEQSLKSTIDAVMKIDDEQELILQEYLKIDNDMRVIVLDGEVIAVMERGKVKNDFRTNFSLGADIKEVQISEEIAKIAKRSAKAVGAYFCGVDIAISGKTRKPFVIEVNSSPGSEGIEKATGQNVTSEFLDYILDKDNWKYPPTVVGRREMISIPEIGDLEAKFDTGNMVVNSIHADSYEVRDGVVYWEMNGEEYQNELLDILTVLQGAVAANKEQRPMIELDIEFMGKKYPKRKFTLDDRSNKGTPVLIGVPFMKEFHIIVDPGKKFIKTERMEEEFLPKAILYLASTLAAMPSFQKIVSKFGGNIDDIFKAIRRTPPMSTAIRKVIKLPSIDNDDIMAAIDSAVNMIETGASFLTMGEATLTKPQLKLRDKYAKDLKKRAKGFKDRYGDNYKDVIFGTATNMAKRKAEEEAADHQYHRGYLEGTPERTKKYKQVTPGQVNEIADTYFNKGGSK